MQKSIYASLKRLYEICNLQETRIQGETEIKQYCACYSYHFISLFQLCINYLSAK